MNTITEGTYSADFVYNADDTRAKITVKNNNVAFLTRTYIGGSYIKESLNGVEKDYTFVGGDAYSAPVVIESSGTTKTPYFLLRDYLGNITHVASNSGSLIYEYSYDAWGRLRNPSDWTNYAVDAEPTLFMVRGFTGHEHLPWFNLTNMNGRLYDPVVGRMLSPDNNVPTPGFTQGFNRYAYALNNPLVYTDPDGEFIWLVPALVGAVINVAVNWNSINNVWQGLGYFGAGAIQGGLAVLGPGGWAAGGAITGASNAALGGASINQITQGGIVGAFSGWAGGALGSWAGQNFGGVVLNGLHVSANSAIGGFVTGAIGGAAGGYAGGFTGGLLTTGDLSAAHNAGVAGLKTGAAIGGGVGAAQGYYNANKAGLNPLTGKPNKSFTIGEGMTTDPKKGWMGVDKISDDLGSDYYKPDSNIPMEGPFKGSTTSNGMYDNAVWIENNVKGTGAYIYDRGAVGNNSQYYNMEVGRTMNYPVTKVTPYYNRAQTIRVLILRK